METALEHIRSRQNAKGGAVCMVPVSLFRAVTSLVDKLNLSSERLIEKVGLPQWQELDPKQLVPGIHYHRLYDAAARAFGSELFGVMAPKYLPIRSYGIVGQTIGQAMTGYEAIHIASACMNRVTNISSFWTVEEVERVWWLRKRYQTGDCSMLHIELATIGYMIDIVRLAAGPGWRPETICLESDMVPGLEKLEQFADAKVHWRQGITSMAIPRSVLSRSVTPAEHPSAAQPAADVSTYPTFSSDPMHSLRQVTRAYLKLGPPTIGQIADATGLNVRTLQRRLAAEGLNYKRLVDQVRFEVAAELLGDPNAPLVDVAFELGYSEQAHFNHAFRRWTGSTPSQYRRQLSRK